MKKLFMVVSLLGLLTGIAMAMCGVSGCTRGHEEHKGAVSSQESETSKQIYSCPMHPEIQQEKPGKCPKCRMNLEKKQLLMTYSCPVNDCEFQQVKPEKCPTHKKRLVKSELIDKARETGARDNLGALRSAIAIYYGDNRGVWPQSLDAQQHTMAGKLFPAYVPGYMSKIPNATLQRSIIVHSNNTNTVTYVTTRSEEEITAGQIGDIGGWVYSSNSGDCRINCNHQDSTANQKTDSTLRYSNYGHEEP